jgi:hypothetical protein
MIERYAKEVTSHLRIWERARKKRTLEINHKQKRWDCLNSP